MRPIFKNLVNEYPKETKVLSKGLLQYITFMSVLGSQRASYNKNHPFTKKG